MLLSEKEFATLRGAGWLPLVAVCDGELSFDVNPVTVLNPEGVYTETGHTSNSLDEHFGLSGSVAYRAGLCYRLTGDVKYAQNAQRIIDAWYRTLKRVEGLQGQNLLGFHMLYFVVAGDWVRGVNGWDGVEFGRYLKNTILPYTRIDYKNNIACWWGALTAGISAYNKDYTGLVFASSKWKEQINKQVCAGSNTVCSASFASDMMPATKLWTLPEELTRSNEGGSNFNSGSSKGYKGIDYSHFCMRALTLCAEILLKEGVNVYNSTEARYFQNVFNKLVGWVHEPVYSPYYARNLRALSQVEKFDYFAPLVLRFEADDADDTTAIERAELMLDNGVRNKPVIGDRWQLDLLFRGNYNAPRS